MKDAEHGEGGEGPERYEVQGHIGRGSAGEVYKGTDKKTGEAVAIKVVDLEEAEVEVEDLQREIRLLAQCRSEHITRYHGSVLAPGTSKLWVIMEYMAGGSLADLIQGDGLDENSIAYSLRELLRAIDYLHGESKIHRDVKAANVLLTDKGEIRLADFGVSGQMTQTLGARRKTFTGTPFWMSPEVIQAGDNGYDEKADIWSVGITAIELAHGQPPYANVHPVRALFLIPKNPPPTLEGGNYSKDFHDFVLKCLQKDPSKRPSAHELLKHRFLQDIKPTYSIMERLQTKAKAREESASPVDPELKPVNLNEGMMQSTPTWDFGTMDGTTGERTVMHKGSSAAIGLPDFGKMEEDDYGGTIRMPAEDAENLRDEIAASVQEEGSYCKSSGSKSSAAFGALLKPLVQSGGECEDSGVLAAMQQAEEREPGWCVRLLKSAFNNLAQQDAQSLDEELQQLQRARTSVQQARAQPQSEVADSRTMSALTKYLLREWEREVFPQEQDVRT